MKPFLILILFLYPLVKYNPQVPDYNWRVIETGCDFVLLRITFSDSLNGWVLGDKAIFHSSDGGESWLKQKIIDSANYRKIVFLNNNSGYVFGNKGLIYTKDGGLNWDEQNINIQNSYVLGLSFVNDSTGWLVSNTVQGENIIETILNTNNAGLKWDTLLVRNSIIKFYDIKFVDSLIGYIIGSDGRDNYAPIYVYKTTDGGKNWINISLFEGAHTFYLYTKNVDTLWAAGIGFAKSIDGGKSWDPFFKIEIEDSLLYGTPDFYDILQENCKNGYAIIVTTKGPNQAKFRLYYTEDSGANWAMIDIPNSFEPMSICSVGKYLFIAGKNGKIMTNKPLPVNVPNNKSNLYFELYQNYPNPFNPSTTISFSLKEYTYVTLKIYNILGIEIKTLLAAYKSTGIYKIIWDGTDNNNNKVSSGTYIIRLMSTRNIREKKTILIK